MGYDGYRAARQRIVWYHIMSEAVGAQQQLLASRDIFVTGHSLVQ